MDDIVAVVIDNGSGSIKADVAGVHTLRRTPRHVFPSVIGVIEDPATPGFNRVIGYEALAHRDVRELVYPIEQGIFTNWRDMERIWQYVFYTRPAIVPPEEYPVLLTEAPLNPKASRERMVKVMFDTFDAPAVFICNQAVLALFASGRTTGTVLLSGDGVTNVVPIYEGHVLHHAIGSIDLAGRDLTMYMMKLVMERGHHVTDVSIVEDIKESLAYVSMDFNSDMKKAAASTVGKGSYILPEGGGVVILFDECFRCPEIYFQPSLIGKGEKGIHNLIFDSIGKCYETIRTELYSNIVLAGGSTLFKGFAERLTAELVALTADSSIEINVVAPPDRQYSVWNGGSMLASHPSFKEMWLYSDEYEASGPSSIHAKIEELNLASLS